MPETLPRTIPALIEHLLASGVKLRADARGPYSGREHDAYVNGAEDERAYVLGLLRSLAPEA